MSRATSADPRSATRKAGVMTGTHVDAHEQHHARMTSGALAVCSGSHQARGRLSQGLQVCVSVVKWQGRRQGVVLLSSNV